MEYFMKVLTSINLQELPWMVQYGKWEFYVYINIF